MVALHPSLNIITPWADGCCQQGEQAVSRKGPGSWITSSSAGTMEPGRMAHGRIVSSLSGGYGMGVHSHGLHLQQVL